MTWLTLLMVMWTNLETLLEQELSTLAMMASSSSEIRSGPARKMENGLGWNHSANVSALF